MKDYKLVWVAAILATGFVAGCFLSGNLNITFSLTKVVPLPVIHSTPKTTIDI